MSEKFRLFGGEEINKIIKSSNKKIIDRSKWPQGPWDNEPDSAQWDLQHGLMGLIYRSNHQGHLCGYVGVPKSHQLYGLEYDHDLLNGVTTHGGLTYSGHMAYDNNIKSNEEFWYFGFDCAHYCDSSPMTTIIRHGNAHIDTGRYRDWDYVTNSVFDLAEQLWTRRGVL